MRNIYYLIWSDAIIKYRKHHPEKINWKITLFIFITWINALTFWIILLWLKFFKIFSLPHIEVNLFPGKMLNSFLVFTLEFALPFALLNYYFIFRNNKYENILNDYKDINSNYALGYSISIAILAFVSAVLYGLFN